MATKLDLEGESDWWDNDTEAKRALAAMNVLVDAGMITKEESVNVRMKIIEKAKTAEPKSPLSIAASKLHAKLIRHFWTDGGFLQAVGEGQHDGKPAVYVYLARKVMGHEEHLIPKEVDGIPVITKVIGKVRISDRDR